MEQAPIDTNYLNEIVGDAERAELERAASNKVLLNALKKIILAGVYYNGTLRPNGQPDAMRNWAMQITDHYRGNLNDSEIGQILRAKRYGVELLEEGFRAVETFEVHQEKTPKKKNKAR